MELLDPVDGHDDSKALVDVVAGHRGERCGPQLPVHPDPGRRTDLDVQVGAVNLGEVRQYGMKIEHYLVPVSYTHLTLPTKA